MKKYFWVILLIAAIEGCTKTTDYTATPNTFSFILGGFTIIGHSYSAKYSVNSEYNLTMSLNAGTADSILIYLKGNYYATPYNYIVGVTEPNNTHVTSQYYVNALTYTGAAGNMEVTSLDTVNNKISGSFQFTFVNIDAPFDTIQISGGKLSTLQYTKTP